LSAPWLTAPSNSGRTLLSNRLEQLARQPRFLAETDLKHHAVSCANELPRHAKNSRERAPIFTQPGDRAAISACLLAAMELEKNRSVLGGRVKIVLGD